jgi:hypothetical protein
MTNAFVIPYHVAFSGVFGSICPPTPETIWGLHFYLPYCFAVGLAGELVPSLSFVLIGTLSQKSVCVYQKRGLGWWLHLIKKGVLEVWRLGKYI